MDTGTAVSNVVLGDMFAAIDTKELSDEGIDVAIMKPDGEPTGLMIHVLGADSDVYERVKDKQDRMRMRALSAKGRAAIDGIFDLTRENEMEITVACCTGWRHESGAALPFDMGTDKAMARQFFERYRIAYDQVRVAIHDRANFTKTPAMP